MLDPQQGQQPTGGDFLKYSHRPTTRPQNRTDLMMTTTAMKNRKRERTL